MSNTFHHLAEYDDSATTFCKNPVNLNSEVNQVNTVQNILINSEDVSSASTLLQQESAYSKIGNEKQGASTEFMHGNPTIPEVISEEGKKQLGPEGTMYGST